MWKPVWNPFHPGDVLSGPIQPCRRITHFHSRGSPLSLLSNQVYLFIFTFHVFFCHVVYPAWTSCRKQQCLRAVLRTWQERSPTSAITMDSHLRLHKLTKHKANEFSQTENFIGTGSQLQKDNLKAMKTFLISFTHKMENYSNVNFNKKLPFLLIPELTLLISKS